MNARLRWVSVALTAFFVALAAGLWAITPWLGIPAALFAGVFAAAVAGYAAFPRIAYDPAGYLKFYVLPYQSHRVPIEHVECFLLGKGPSMMPGQRRWEARTLSIRIDERRPEFARRPTDRRLAGWCASQCTFCGTWCEPFTLEKVQQLNRWLTQAQREARGASRPLGCGEAGSGACESSAGRGPVAETSSPVAVNRQEPGSS